MNILYITTIGSTMDFFKSFIKSQLKLGNKIDIATNENNGKEVPSCYCEWGCRIYHIDTSRSPINLGNFRAIKQIRELVKNNRYDIVHCHTPIAAAVTRIACKNMRKSGVRVIYTAHGFHFYNGAPIKNWMLYYPIEKWLSRYTDVLITINKEDYEKARRKFNVTRIEYVPGIGIDVDKFKQNKNGRQKIRRELGIDDNRIILLSVGELNDNKNHTSVIRALEGIKKITYVIVGRGELGDHLLHLANEYKVDLRLMGYRDDVADFYKAADAYILPSFREGLNVSLMEAMASELACCASRIRGNTDLIERPLFCPSDINEIKDAIKFTIDNKREIIKNNSNTIERYRDSIVKDSINNIYAMSNNYIK